MPVNLSNFPRNLFLCFGLLYLGGGVILFNLEATLLLSTYLFFFIMGWFSIDCDVRISLLPRRFTDLSQYEISSLITLAYLAIFFFIGVGLLMIVNNGIESYFFVSRSSRALVTRDSLLISVFDTVIVGLFWLITAINIYFNLRCGWKYYLIVLLIAAYGVLTISLSTIVSLLVPLYMLNWRKVKISRHLWIFASIGLIISSAWKPVMGAIILGYELNLSGLEYPRELLTWVEIFENIINASSQWRDPLLGQSYIDALVSIFLPFYDITSLSVAYVTHFAPEVYERGGGRGFSTPLEAYLNFRYFGVVIVGFLVGIFFRLISNNCIKSAFNMFLMIALCSIAFKFFRSESYSIFKNLFWLQILPVLLLYLSVKIRHSFRKATH